jgi:hypothetical protein
MGKINMFDWLLAHPEPIIRYQTRVLLLEQNSQASEVRKIQQEIHSSERIQRLLSDCDEHGEIPFHPYTKWQGAHWVLTVLADTGYPPGDSALLPLRDQVYGWLFSEEHLDLIRKMRYSSGQVPYRQPRLHASMEANAIFATLSLGIADDRIEKLVERLLQTQWDDGGWNCDRHKKADTSSFYESISPLRALARYARETGDSQAQAAAKRCAEVFLSRRLYRRLSDGEVMRADFLKPRYPRFWFYDILFALKVLAEAGLINDPRCQDALDVIEAKRLPDGGFAAEGKHYVVYRVPGKIMHRGTRVDWGPAAPSQPNPYITIDALYVLKAAGREK